VQVKTTAADGNNIRVRRLGSSDALDPADRYDQLAVVNQHRLWIIPATKLDGRDDITMHPLNINCPWNGYRKR
jgi:hypothetical protein